MTCCIFLPVAGIIYIYGDTDMRKGFEQPELALWFPGCEHNVLGGDIFIFINKRRNQVKLLQWEGDGFALYYKRLEKKGTI